MSAPETPRLRTDMAGLAGCVGETLGPTAWRMMEQERVDRFADATDDHQYIHVDPERAAASPFGATIAHGYLTLALVAPVLGELVTVTDAATGIKLRPGPRSLPRAAARRSAVAGHGGDARGHRDTRRGPARGVTIEVEGSPKPAMVADALVRQYR